MKSEDSVKKALEAGQSLQEIIGYTQENMEQFYHAAYALFQEGGKEKDAADAFFFLTVLNPAVPTYWLALGMAEQCLNHYQEALSAYAMASLTEVEDPISYYQSALCYYALHDKENMTKSLEMAAQYLKDIPAHATMKETVRFLLGA